jgi:hypothetical protein
VTDATFYGDLTQTFHTLMYFPGPDLARLVQFGEGRKYIDPAPLNAHADLLIIAAVYGHVPIADIPTNRFDERVRLVLLYLLNRLLFEPVLDFAEKAGLMLDVALEIKEGIERFGGYLISHPDVLCRALAHSESEAVMIEVVKELAKSGKAAIEEILAGLNRSGPVKGLLAALRELGFRDGRRIWRFCDRIEEGSVDALFELIGTFPADEVQLNFGVLLPLLRTNTVARLRQVFHVIDDQIASLEGWKIVVDSIAESSSEVIEEFALQIWPIQSLRPSVEFLLLGRPRPIRDALLGIVEAFRVTQHNLSVFFGFISGFMQAHSISGVSRICAQILRDASTADYGQITIDLDILFSFLVNAPYIDSLLMLLVLVCQANSAFVADLKDEVDTLLKRPAEVPHVVLLDIALLAKSATDALARYQRACARPDCERTSELAFHFFENRNFPPRDILALTFALAPAESKIEKRVLRGAVLALSDLEFADFVKTWSSRLIPTALQLSDARKLHLLLKWRPAARPSILETVQMTKERANAIASVNEGAALYLRRIFAD